MASTVAQYGLVPLGICAFWWICRHIFGSSPLHNIPGPPSTSILTGNLPDFIDPDGWEFQKALEQDYGQVVKIQGLLGAPQLYIFDPVALHSIFVQDADAYETPQVYMTFYGLLWGRGLFSSTGEDHHRYRKIAMPAFAPAKLRELIPLFYEVAEKARDGLISPFLVCGPAKVDLNNVLERTSLEMIGRTGIGYSFDPMIPGQTPEDKYAETVKGLLPTEFKMGLLLPLLPRASRIGSAAFRRFVVNAIPSKTLHRARDLVDHMESTARELIRTKKEAIARGQLDTTDNSKDIMSLLLKGNLTAEEGMFLTDDELVGQTGMIISAATDTTSSALDRNFHLLSVYPDMQERLRAEILEYPEHMDYEQLGSLPFMDAFLHEVLRLYPPVTPVMHRETLKDSILPLSTPLVGVDGKEITSIAVPKGTTVYIAIAAANHNRLVWGEDALEFKPERWQNGKASVHAAKMGGVWGNTMSFLGGARSCIGFQFSLLEIKVILSVFLRTFRFSAAGGSVQWKMSGVMVVPSVDGKTQLPITVENIKHQL
ncbi:cytochrome P450 [Mycena capillaripes]|nr:cytochrome P450 [Mycena capillaripes]